MAKPAVDIGIVTTDAPAMLAFYRDLLQIPFVAEIPAPGIGTLFKLQWGDSAIKILAPSAPPEITPPSPRFAGATGIHYLTLVVADLAGSLERCRGAGAPVLIEATQVRPGVSAAIVADPDGNPVELMQRP